MAALKPTIICFGCGGKTSVFSLILDTIIILNLLSSKTLTVWKRLAEMIMPNVDLDSILVNEDGTAGKICRSCSAALQRLDKLGV